MILVPAQPATLVANWSWQLHAAEEPVRALVRSTDRAGTLLGVETAAGDLNDPASLAPALKGIRGVFLLGGYADMPGILAMIRQAGVERVVLLSSRSVLGGKPDNAIADMWMKSETAVRSSGVSWTIRSRAVLCRMRFAGLRRSGRAT
jgi:uncharacterized protein YbjT (DUF2867 family)